MSMRHWMTASLFALALGAATTADAAQRRDRDHNPPGPAGGRGTNWENPPGLEGRPGRFAGSPLVPARRQALRIPGRAERLLLQPRLRLLASEPRIVEPGATLLAGSRQQPAGPAWWSRYQLGKPAGLERWSWRLAEPLRPLPLKRSIGTRQRPDLRPLSSSPNPVCAIRASARSPAQPAHRDPAQRRRAAMHRRVPRRSPRAAWHARPCARP